MPSTEAETRHRYTRIPLMVVAEMPGLARETYAGRDGRVFLEAHHLAPEGVPADTACLFMHPAGVLNYLPLPIALARSGVHVVCCASRYASNDSALIMENVLIDLCAAVRHLKERLGFRRVVLCGWSGGGSLSLFYQSQAQAPDITATPAGDPVDIAGAGLIPADGVMLLAPHLSRARTLREWIDAAVVDETDPDASDPALDLYADRPCAVPPFTAAFLARYRAAQAARVARITARVRARLRALSDMGRPGREEGFVVHRTMADPRWLDPAVDPNDRRPGWCYLGEPRAANHATYGLARFTTLRSWLSQWCPASSRADGEACAARMQVPVLGVENGADDACTPEHTRTLFAAVPHADKDLVTIAGANHYYYDQPRELAEAARACREWLGARGFLP
ncbi:MAG: alpha/beta fold hydrolase [Rhodobacteraceae bacterium]|nr:alpha/beta fold hydrolase [Paracoccaceae bacterium]